MNDVLKMMGKLNKGNWEEEALPTLQAVVDTVAPGSGYTVEFGKDFQMAPWPAEKHVLQVPTDVKGYFEEFGYLLRPEDNEVLCALHEIGHVVDEYTTQRSQEETQDLQWRMELTFRYHLSDRCDVDELEAQAVYERLPVEVAADRWAYEQIGKELPVEPIELLTQEEAEVMASLMDEEWEAHMAKWAEENSRRIEEELDTL